MLVYSLGLWIGIIVLRKRNQCIFCQGSGMSKEHFWSSWMDSVIPKGEKNEYTNIILSGQDENLSMDSISVRQGDVITKKIRVVCKKCNSGWMSRIEETVKPILLKLMNGTADLITPLE